MRIDGQTSQKKKRCLTGARSTTHRSRPAIIISRLTADREVFLHINNTEEILFTGAMASRYATFLAASILLSISGSWGFLQRSTRSQNVATVCNLVQDIPRPPTFLDESEDGDLNVLFLSSEDDDEDDTEATQKPQGAGKKRWESLNPKVKQRLIEKGQSKAIANKKKREPAADKKRSELKIY